MDSIFLQHKLISKALNEGECLDEAHCLLHQRKRSFNVVQMDFILVIQDMLYALDI